MRLKAGTRGSKLALIQTDLVIGMLRNVAPGTSVETNIIKTAGDRDQATPINELGGDGAFEKELDAAVLNGDVDFAVHSLKDVPTQLAEDLVIAAVPKRAHPNDVLVSRTSAWLEELADGAVVGTGSVLRESELRRSRRGLIINPIRGNIDTRLSKLDSGEYDAIVLAEAALARMGLQHRIAQVLPIDAFVPAAGQGAMAVVCRADNAELLRELGKLDDQQSRVEVSAERTVMSLLGGDCRAPIGVIGRTSLGTLSLSCVVFSTTGAAILRSVSGGSDAYEELARSLSRAMISDGAVLFVREWQQAKGQPQMVQ